MCKESRHRCRYPSRTGKCALRVFLLCTYIYHLYSILNSPRNGGQGRIRTCEARRPRIYNPLALTACIPAHNGDQGRNHTGINGVAIRYVTICFLHHEKKCVICEESRIVTVHHLDENHENNNPANLISLCPTHHQYWHSRYRYLIEEAVFRYIKEWSARSDSNRRSQPSEGHGNDQTSLRTATERLVQHSGIEPDPPGLHAGALPFKLVLLRSNAERLDGEI